MQVKKIVLKYNNPQFQSYHQGNEVFVDLDSASGGYPYQVNAMKAYDFGTIEKAKEYPCSRDDFSVVELTYDVSERHIENLKK